MFRQTHTTTPKDKMNMEIIVGVQNGGPEERKGRGGSRRSDNNKLKKKPEETRTCRLTNLLAKPRFTTTTPLYHLQGRYAPRYTICIFPLICKLRYYRTTKKEPET